MRGASPKVLLAASCLVVACLAEADEFPSVLPVVDFPPATRAIIGTPDFEKVRDLPRGSTIRKLAESVAFIDLGRGSCTGFLVGPDLLMTNQHCVEHGPNDTRVAPNTLEIYMEYHDANEKGPLGAVGREFLAVNKDLDYALVRLTEPLGERHGTLNLSQQLPSSRSPVKVIQHPRGREKEFSRKDAGVVARYASRNVLHYRADTEPGSSGSPVFSAGGERVIALHHAGRRDQYNEGMLMSKIVADLARRGITIDGTQPAGAGSAGPGENWRQLDAIARASKPLEVRANRSVYRYGDHLEFDIEVPDVGYLYVFNIDGQDTVTQLYPNSYETDNRLSPGRMRFPTDRMPFKLKASPPSGDQLVVAVLSPRQIKEGRFGGESGGVFDQLMAPRVRSFTVEATAGGQWAGRLLVKIAE